MRTRTNYLTAMRGAAASHAFAGRLTKARQLMAQVRESNSALRLSQIKDLIPLNRARDFERWIEGLYKSGLPE
jgi:adenylate cyclase